ncbi:hypothetical protein [Rhodococcoides yunnanense]|uniref:hypothetical protein n=1 Tax=Rhodococcoides yunnanense TaxID=278209 RepID=UPI00157E05F8|nr:hypothetical protein [Rhodococcus yunnanensis]
MEMRTRLMVLAASLVAFNAALWSIPKIAPEAPGRWEGVQPAAPPTASASTTPPPPLPADFPSMERPPKISVADGEPQPIATKYGLTYEIPPGWQNRDSAVAGWDSNGETLAIYGSLGYYGRTDCAENGEHTELAWTGVTGRRDTDLDASALEEIEKARRIYSNADESASPTVTISGPKQITIDDRPAVRYTAVVEQIPDAEKECVSSTATMDVVTTPGYASAETALFVVFADRGKENALTDSDIDQILSTIRKS